MSDVPPPPPPPAPPPPPPPSPQPGGSPSGGPDIGGAISWAISGFGKNAGVMIGLAAVVMVAGLVGWLLRSALNPLVDRFVYNCDTVETAEQLNACLARGGAGLFATFLGGIVLQIVIFVIVILAEIGLINASLKLTRGEKPAFSDIWHPQHGWLYFFVALVTGVLIGIGFIFCIIPGLILLWLWQFTRYAALDRGQGFGDAFSTGTRAVLDNKGPAVLTLLVVFAASLITVFTCGIGALVVYPFTDLFMANMYRQFRKEPVVPVA